MTRKSPDIEDGGCHICDNLKCGNNKTNKPKLRTLEDIDKPLELTTREFKRRLKIEAIEWIKELENFQSRLLKLDEPQRSSITSEFQDLIVLRRIDTMLDYKELMILKQWIKHFFNITEDDLLR